MAVSTMWIKNNMLFPPTDQLERQLTEAELKVQRSILKLSIPDWYMNKRSNPPRILNNATPIEFRQSSWKIMENKNSTLSDSLSHTKSSTTPEKSCANEIPKISKQKSPEAKHKKSASKSSSPKVEVFDTTIPEVKLSMNISRTFPKMSPSRKIQNINIVFPPVPRTKNSSSVVKATKREVVAPEDQSIDSNTKTDNDISKDETPLKTSTQTTKDNDFQFSNITDTPARTPYAKGSFKVRAASTPRFTPANLFSSTIIEETPKVKKVPSRSILEKSSIFEDRSNSFPETSPENVPRPRKLSKSLLEKASFFEDSSKSGQAASSFETSSKSRNCSSSFLEKNLRSIDPIFFEKDDAALGIPKSSTLVREIVTRLEVSGDGVSTPEKKSTLEWKRITASVQERKSNLEAKRAAPIVQTKKPKLPLDPKTESPCTRFMNSRRKSMDLENVVRSKLPGRENTMVRGIIEALTEKVSKPVPRQIEAAGANQSFVKQLVNALEKGGVVSATGKASRKDSMSEDESCSESCATTTSLKDTDSSSDSEHRSAILRSDEESLTNDSTVTTKGSQGDRKPQPEEDSVYWIPVSRCKLPRSSSLLSMMSRLSGNGQSPCVSPIRSDSEAECSQMPERGGTFKKTNNALSRKLFRIDETTVIDSGYSDRSDRSGACGFVTCSTWSEDSQNDSTLENTATRVKRSSRSKLTIGQTFRVSC